MKLSPLTTALAVTVLSVNIVFAQVSVPQTPTIELLPGETDQSNQTGSATSFPYSIELNAETCGTSASWKQSVGPTGVKILGAGNQTVAQVYQPGTYEFEYGCCAFDRKSSLLSSSSLIGFGENTTGGLNSTGFTVVTNTNDDGPGSLRQALDIKGPNWITFDAGINGRTIYLKSELNVTNSDITIDGRGSTITLSPANDNSLVMALRGGNTILHGIKLDGQGRRATALMIREGRNYWIDHVTITNFSGDDAISIGQGNKLDTSASEITISNYRAHATSKGLKGGGNGTYPNFPVNRVTVHTSELAAEERNPRPQYGSLFHVFNTYVHSFVYAGMDAGRNAQIISENNVLSALNARNSNNAQMGRFATAKYYPLEGTVGPVGHVFSHGDLFLDDAASTGSINPTNPPPFTIPYSYTLLDVNLVRDTVLRNAGVENMDNSISQCQVQRISRTVP